MEATAYPTVASSHKSTAITVDDIRWSAAPPPQWERLFVDIDDLDESTLRFYARELQDETRILRTLVHTLLASQHDLTIRLERSTRSLRALLKIPPPREPSARPQRVAVDVQ